MSGMAGNVTAFNTVWTYDIYQSHIRPRARRTRTTCGWDGFATVGGDRCSRSAAAYVASAFNNIMDLLQLVFAFVERPALRHLRARHVLATDDRPRRVRRAPVAASLGRGGSPRAHASRRARTPGVKGGFIGALHTYPERAGADVLDRDRRVDDLLRGHRSLVSLATRPRPAEELRGLVYSLTPRPSDEACPGFARPWVLGRGRSRADARPQLRVLLERLR